MDFLESASSKYKLKLKYGGYFRKVKNSSKKRYCFGYQKCVYIDTSIYMIEHLIEEVRNRYPSNRGLVLSMWFVDKSVDEHPFTQLITMDDFNLMLTMYELEKEVTIYVTRDDDQVVVDDIVVVHEPNEDEDSEYCLSVESYHSKLSTDVEFEYLSDEIANVREDELTYINENHSKIWSRSKFGTTSKCDYITNNISEAFNSWIGELRYQPTLDLLDSIREKIMARFDKKRTILKTWKGLIVPNAKRYLKNISKNLGEYEISRSGDYLAKVKYQGRRWEVLLDEQKCTCRVWQVKGLPCYHAAAVIALTRDKWERYVDPYFTIEKYKSAYDSEIAPMPAKDEWVRATTDEKIYPPSIKRPSGRPRKNRIRSHDESKKRHKCSRCGEYGHHGKTCKNSASQAPNDNQISIGKKGRGQKAK